MQAVRRLAPVQPADASHMLLLRQSLSLVHAAPFARPDCSRSPGHAAQRVRLGEGAVHMGTMLCS